MWAYIRRNRGKILAGIAVVGGSAYAIKKTIDFVEEKRVTNDNLQSYYPDVLKVCYLALIFA